MSSGFRGALTWLQSSSVRLLLIALVSTLLVRLLASMVNRILHLMANGGGAPATEAEKRARTVASLLRTLGTFLIVLVAVLMALRGVGQALAADDAFGKLVLEPPQILGVEALGESQVTIRLLMKTLPSGQCDVARELRRRVKVRSDRERVAIPYPHRVIIYRSSA